MHGYEMIQEIAERSGGAWRPSPGSVYPTLQLLEDEGLITSASEGGKKLFTLTDSGRTEAEAGPDAPWEDAGRGVDWDALNEVRKVGGGLIEAFRQVWVDRDARAARQGAGRGQRRPQEALPDPRRRGHGGELTPAARGPRGTPAPTRGGPYRARVSTYHRTAAPSHRPRRLRSPGPVGPMPSPRCPRSGPVGGPGPPTRRRHPAAGDPLDPRTTRRVGTMCCSSAALPRPGPASSMVRSAATAASPSARWSCATVVSAGRTSAAASMSSKPTTARSPRHGQARVRRRVHRADRHLVARGEDRGRRLGRRTAAGGPRPVRCRGRSRPRRRTLRAPPGPAARTRAGSPRGVRRPAAGAAGR